MAHAKAVAAEARDTAAPCAGPASGHAPECGTVAGASTGPHCRPGPGPCRCLSAGRSGRPAGTVPHDSGWARSGQAEARRTSFLCSLPASVHPGKDAATAAGQLNPPAGPMGYTTPAWLCQPVSAVSGNSLPRPVVQPARWVRVPGPGEHLGDQEADTDRPCVATGQGAHEEFNGAQGCSCALGTSPTCASSLPSSSTCRAQSPQLARSRGPVCAVHGPAAR